MLRFFLHILTDWERNLLDYSKAHPDVTVIDRVDGIRALQNRSTMLSALSGEGIMLQVGGLQCLCLCVCGS